MTDPLVARLQLFEPLSEVEIEALTSLTERVIAYDKHRDLLQQGDSLNHLYLMRQGWACRYTILPGGKRQIISFVIPGDLCNDHVLLFHRMEHSIATLTPCELGVISPHRFLQVLAAHPRITRGLYWSGFVMEAVLRERIVSLGRRTATQRIAHLFCELLLRLRAAGLAHDHSFDLPLTQLDIADTLGLNHVHVNRVIRTMRKLGLIRLKRHVLEIPNWDDLTALGEFDPRHLNGFVGHTDQATAPRDRLP
ncbi:Crp/Fnr family transcriptional regulator [Microvirga yunnanensis]|uniref:Crp/Fnr family transcriptional regulator n=1 Tax=Microvirga yunnanensis TaxID=2953740 RepID=UPI0021CA78AB|nr:MULTISPECIES: Crp/Fnr family transcriptional regulator [unclassified Microvirga]